MAKKHQYWLPFEDSSIRTRLEALAEYLGGNYIYNNKPSPKRLIEAIAYGKIHLEEASGGKFYIEEASGDLIARPWFSTWSSTRWQSLLLATWVCLESNQYAAACELVSLLSMRDSADPFWQEQIAYLRSTEWFARHELLYRFIKSKQPFCLDYDNGSGVESHVIRHAFVERSPRFRLTFIRAFSSKVRSPDSEPIESLACNYSFCFDRIVRVVPHVADGVEWLGSMPSVEVIFELPGFQQYLRHPYDLGQEVLPDGRRRVTRAVYNTSDLREDLARYLPNFEIRSPTSMRSYFSGIARQMYSNHS